MNIARFKLVSWREKIFSPSQTFTTFKASVVKFEFIFDDIHSKPTASILGVAALQAWPLVVTSWPNQSYYVAVAQGLGRSVVLLRPLADQSRFLRDDFADSSNLFYRIQARCLIVWRRIRPLVEDFRPQPVLIYDMDDVGHAPV